MLSNVLGYFTPAESLLFHLLVGNKHFSDHQAFFWNRNFQQTVELHLINGPHFTSQLLLKVHAIPSFAQLVFKARASSESSSLLWNFNLSTTLGPENIFLFVLQKVPREVWVGCGFCEEVSGRRNCFQRLGKHDLHLAVDFLRRAGAPRC